MAPNQQAQQAALASLLTDPLEAAWLRLDLANLKATLPDFTTAVTALVQQYGRSSGTTAAIDYSAQRAAAGIRGTFTVRPAPPASFEEVDKSIGWATKGLWDEQPDIESAKTLIKGVTEKAVLDTGRNTIINAVHSDRRARGWAREVEPGACSFCLLLATRGAVYRSEKTADFKSHDHCRCTAVPVFGIYEPTAEIRDAAALYRESIKGAHGPKASRAAFRKAVEARS